MQISSAKREFSSYTPNQTATKEDSNSSFSLMLENSKNLYLKGEVASNPAVALSFLNPTKNSVEITNDTREENAKKEEIKALKAEFEELKRQHKKERNIQEAIRQAFEIKQLGIQIDLLQGEAFGYSIDENGFMGEDFNAAAGLPLDYKIVYKHLGEFYYDETTRFDSYYKEIDMAKTIHNDFVFFQDLVGDLSQSNRMLSPDEIKALPQRNIYAYYPTAEDRDLIMQLNLQENKNFMESWDKISKTGISVPFFIHCSLMDIDKTLQQRQDPRFSVEERYFEGDKISTSGLFIMSCLGSDIVGERSEFFYESRKENERFYAQMLRTNEFPNTYVINYDTEQRFWDLLNGKISVESHLQELIDLGYTHNNTIVWDEDRERFANSLTHFLKVFQEILDSHSLNAQELQTLNKQESYNTQAKQALQDSKNLKDSKESKESKPYESQTKQEKMNTFLNHLLKVG